MSIISSLPYTLTNGQTADATQVMANFNQIVNNVNANAAASGANADITSLSGLTTPLTPGQGGTPLFSGGTTTGSANAQVIGSSLPDSFTLVTQYLVSFIAGYTNTGPMTLAFNSTTATAVYKATHSGIAALVGGEIVAGNSYMAIFDGTEYVLLNHPVVPGIPWANAGGTAQAITAAYVPINESLTDGLILGFRASAANTGTAPTFAPDGLTAEPIVKEGGVALVAGDIPNALAEMIVRYNLANTRWELLNPAQAVLSPPAWQITGYLPSSISGTDTTASLTVSTGQATDTTDAVFITKNTTTSWAVSNGNAINGYQGGSTLPNSTAIHFYICNGSSGTGVFASSSLTPTLPTGYATYYRRIFSLLTTSAGALIPVVTNETGGGAVEFFYSPALGALDVNGNASTASRTLYTLTLPTGLILKANINLQFDAGSVAAQTLWVSNPAAHDDTPATAATPLGMTLYTGTTSPPIVETGTTVQQWTNTSAQIGIRGIQAGPIYVQTLSYMDPRRN